jgi:hypothetical protein
MAAYLLALEVEPMEIDKDYPMLPLHCTLVHWFWSGTDPESFQEQLRAALHDTPVQQLRVSDPAIFTGHTKRGPIPVNVNKIAPNAMLTKLHNRMCEVIDEVGGEYTAPQHVKSGYNPHITHQKGSPKPVEGNVITAKAVYLVSAAAPEYGNPRHILAKFNLGI